MAQRYRYRPDGLIDAETSAGWLPMPAADQDLSELGYLLDQEGPDLGPDERLAKIPEGPLGGFKSPAGPPPPEARAMDAPAPSIGAAIKGEDPGFKAPPKESTSLAPKEEDIDTGQGGGEAAPSPPEEGKPVYKLIPGQDQKASWQVEKGAKLSPEFKQREEEQNFNELFNVTQQGDRNVEIAKRNQEIQDRAIGFHESQRDAAQIRLADMRRDYNERQAKIDAERKAIDELKVDPDRIYSGDRGTFARILAAISIMAGGALMGSQGRASNPGLDAVNAAIDRDIQLQKEQIARRRQGLEGRETELERLMKTYGDPKLAEEELRDRQWKLTLAQADRMTMQSPEDVRLATEEALTKKKSEILTREEAREIAFQDKVRENHIHTPDRLVQIGGPPPKSKSEEAEEDKHRVVIDGVEGFASDREGVKSAVTAYDQAIDALNVQEALAEKSKTDENARKELDAQKPGVVNLIAKTYGKNPSEGDRKDADSLLGKAENFTGSAEEAKKRIQATREHLTRNRNRFIQNNVTKDLKGKVPFKQGLAKGKAQRD